MNIIDMRDAFFEKLVEAARTDERIIVLSADHGAFALKKFEEEMPSRYINMGIAEQNMVGVAAGLAASGKIVFIYGITPFVSLRVLEQLTVDVAAMQLPVNVISVGAGFTYSTDGPTHQGLQDVAAIATIPGLTILNSSDPENTKAFVKLAIESKKPHYIRIEKEKLNPFNGPQNESENFQKGISILKQGTSGVTFISTGVVSHYVLSAAYTLEKLHNISVTVIDIYRLKEFPEEILLPWLQESEWCYCISELYESFLETHIGYIIAKYKINLLLRSFGIPDGFYFSGDERENLLSDLGLDTKSIVSRAIETFKTVKD